MAIAGAYWPMHYLGSSKHAFTDFDAPNIGDPELGRVYDVLDSKRTWAMAYYLFDEVCT